MTPLLAVPLAALLALGAWRAKALAPSGGAAAVLVGAAVLIGTGWWGGAILLTFFIGSTAISRTLPDPAAAAGEAKGGARDAGQVLANGGAPALGALIGLSDPTTGLWALTIGLAAAAADTWATAVGATSPTPPRDLLTLKRVAVGTSGGVTWRGTFGAFGGAFTVSVAGAWATGDLRLASFGTIFGAIGMVLDSLLGATIQGRFRCDACGVPTERRVHRCGGRTRRLSGVAGVTNDAVNLITTLTLTALGVAAAVTIARSDLYNA